MKRSFRLAAGLAAAALTAAGLTATGPAASAAPGADFETSANSQAPAGTRAFGVTFSGVLLSFRLDDPRRDVRRFQKLSGFSGGDTRVVGMDMRPSNRRIYAVGNNGGVYIVQLQNSALTRVGTVGGPGLEGARFGVDFNPAADALRIVSNTGQNLRLTFTGNQVNETFVDGDLSSPPTEGTTTGISAAAYTNSDNSDVTGTTLLDLNTATNSVAVQAPANAGTLSSVGSFRLGVGGEASFDIFPTTDRAGVTRDNAGYAVMQQNGNKILFRINLTTGQATRVGAFRPGAQVRQMAVQLG